MVFKLIYKLFFVGAFAMLLCSFKTAFSSRSKHRRPFSSKKSAQDRLKESSRVMPVFPSLYWRTSSYISSNLLIGKIDKVIKIAQKSVSWHLNQILFFSIFSLIDRLLTFSCLRMLPTLSQDLNRPDLSLQPLRIFLFLCRLCTPLEPSS